MNTRALTKGDPIQGFSVKFPRSWGIVELKGTIFHHRSKGGLWVYTSLGPHCIGKDFFLTEEEAKDFYLRSRFSEVIGTLTP